MFRIVGLLLGLGELMVLAAGRQPGEVACRADLAESRAAMGAHPVPVDPPMDAALAENSMPLPAAKLRERVLRFAVGMLLLGGIVFGLSALPKDDSSWRCAVVGLHHYCK